MMEFETSGAKGGSKVSSNTTGIPKLTQERALCYLGKGNKYDFCQLPGNNWLFQDFAKPIQSLLS
jgi:hypothetical protein